MGAVPERHRLVRGCKGNMEAKRYGGGTGRHRLVRGCKGNMGAKRYGGGTVAVSVGKGL